MDQRPIWSNGSRKCAVAFCEAARVKDSLSTVAAKLSREFQHPTNPRRVIDANIVRNALNSEAFPRLVRQVAVTDGEVLLGKFRSSTSSNNRSKPSPPKRWGE